MKIKETAHNKFAIAEHIEKHATETLVSELLDSWNASVYDQFCYYADKYNRDNDGIHYESFMAHFRERAAIAFMDFMYGSKYADERIAEHEEGGLLWLKWIGECSDPGMEYPWFDEPLVVPDC